MFKSRHLVRVIAISLLIVLNLQMGAGAASVNSLKTKLQKNSSSIRSVQAKLRYTKKKQKNAITDLSVAERRLKTTRSGLYDIQHQLKKTKNRLLASQMLLAQAETRLDERSRLLSKRLVDVYKHGNVTYVGMILGSDDFWDLLTRTYAIRKIVESDNELIRDIIEDKRVIEAQKNALAKQAAIRAQLEYKHRMLTRAAYNIKAERRRILQDIQNQRRHYESMLAALERDSRSIEAMLRRMEQTPRGRKRLMQAWKGSFAKPVQGRISSGFGMRYHPILKRTKMHTGVDIAAPAGATIRAAGTGEVIYAGWYGAYGNTVMIDHGGGVVTLYGHCSSVQARKGAIVKKGQPIARVGSTGWSTGNHCHFEVRKHGRPVNPL